MFDLKIHVGNFDLCFMTQALYILFKLCTWIDLDPFYDVEVIASFDLQSG